MDRKQKLNFYMVIVLTINTMSEIAYFIGGALVGLVIMGISALIYNSEQATERAREKRLFTAKTNKYYILNLDYFECLEFLNEYENVMTAFNLIHNMYTRGTDGDCLHGETYQNCPECKKYGNNSFMTWLGEGYEKVYCTWLRTYVNPLRDAPIVNTVILPITTNQVGAFRHHHRIKDIVGKLRAFYNKYDNQLVNDSAYMKYRPYIIRYFERYDIDAANIANMAQAKLAIAQVVTDYEKDKKE